MKINEEVLGTKAGENFKVTVPGFGSYNLDGGGGSGHVPPGLYQLTTQEFALTDKKPGEDGQAREGKNIKFGFVISGPAAYAGVPIFEWVPVPVGDAEMIREDKGMQIAVSKLSGYKASVHSGLGDLKKAQESENTELTSEWANGKVCYARLADDTSSWTDKKTGETRTSTRSKIARFTSKDKYEQNPGPIAGFAATANTGNGASRPQRSVPEIGGAVDKALGL